VGMMVGLAVLALAVVLGLVLRSDQRYLLSWGGPLDAARSAGRWDEVRTRAWAHYRSKRLLVLLQRRLQPGAAETQLAVELMGLGDRDDALALSDEAMRLSAGHPLVGPVAASTRALVLTNAERFAEAAALREELTARARPGSPRLVPVALALLQLGQLDAAVTLLREVVTAAPDSDPARLVLGQALAWKGRFDEALGVLATSPGARSPASRTRTGRCWSAPTTGWPSWSGCAPASRASSARPGCWPWPRCR
jgi:tetratricopeptide (TPR) repeat protein